MKTSGKWETPWELAEERGGCGSTINGGSNHPQPSVWGGVGFFLPTQTPDPSSDPFGDGGEWKESRI